MVVLVGDPPVPDPAEPGRARPEDVRRQGHDVLRPLDLQVRDGREARRRRGADRPRDGAGRATRSRSCRARRPSSSTWRRPTGTSGRAAVEGWITLDQAKGLFADGRPGLRRAQEAGRDPRVQAGPPRGDGVGRAREHDPEGRPRPTSSARIEGSDPVAEGRVGRSTRRTGTTSASAPAVNGDTIYHGAIDNATGMGGLHRAGARVQRDAPRPRRSILFLFVTGEEQGLLGSTGYAEHPLYPLAKTVAVLNIDALNVHGRTRDLTIVGLGLSGPRRVGAEGGGGPGPRGEAAIRCRRRAPTTGRITSPSRARGCRRSTRAAGSITSASRPTTARGCREEYIRERLPQAVGQR